MLVITPSFLSLFLSRISQHQLPAGPKFFFSAQHWKGTICYVGGLKLWPLNYHPSGHGLQIPFKMSFNSLQWEKFYSRMQQYPKWDVRNLCPWLMQDRPDWSRNIFTSLEKESWHSTYCVTEGNKVFIVRTAVFLLHEKQARLISYWFW